MSPAARTPDETTYAGRFAARLKVLRLKTGFSVEHVASTIGIPARTYYGWENGTRQPPLDSIPAIAKSLKVTPRVLIPRK